MRNYTSYNFQTLRDDVFMLGSDGTVTGRRVCAGALSLRGLCQLAECQSRVDLLSAADRFGRRLQRPVVQPAFPHTVRTEETRGCTDCHISSEKRQQRDIWLMALMQGTNFYNFLGRFVYVAAGKAGLEAVVATERDEPQAVIGSSLHKLAYPEEYKKHKVHHEETERTL